MWAIRSEFVGIGDDGHTMPNYANLVGFALSSIVANAYTPRGSVVRGYRESISDQNRGEHGDERGKGIWGVQSRQGFGSPLEIGRRVG